MTDTMHRSRKRKLLVILGAGSSVPCGMPKVEEIDDRMKSWSREWDSLPTFRAGTMRGVFNDLWELVERYNSLVPRPQLGLRVNFERVLGEMTALASWVTPAPFGNALRIAIRDGALNDGLTWPPSEAWGPHFHPQLIADQMASLLESLAAYMRDCCKSLDTGSTAFADYKSLLTRLRNEFEVGIYNLNYDDVAQRAWPDAFNGFIDNRFDARGVGLRREWNFIYHLHGSVHYSFSNSAAAKEVIWLDDLDGNFDVCQRLTGETAGEFRPILPSTLVAGGYKLDQLLTDPAQSFHASLVRHIHEADAVLIAGYGFGDVHVNRALRNRFDLTATNPAGRPPVAVLTKTTPGPHASLKIRQSDEFWTWELKRTLNCTFSWNEAQPTSYLSVGELIGAQEFEPDMSDRTGIWHGGFLEAVGCIDRVVAWLCR